MIKEIKFDYNNHSCTVYPALAKALKIQDDKRLMSIARYLVERHFNGDYGSVITEVVDANKAVLDAGEGVVKSIYELDFAIERVFLLTTFKSDEEPVTVIKSAIDL